MEGYHFPSVPPSSVIPGPLSGINETPCSPRHSARQMFINCELNQVERTVPAKSSRTLGIELKCRDSAE